MAYQAPKEYFQVSNRELFNRFDQANIIFFLLLDENCLKTIDYEIDNFNEALTIDTPALFCAPTKKDYGLSHFYQEFEKRSLTSSMENFIKANEIIASYYELHPSDLPAIIIAHKGCQERAIVHHACFQETKFSDFKGIAKAVLKFRKFYKKMINQKGSENWSYSEKFHHLQNIIETKLFYVTKFRGSESEAHKGMMAALFNSQYKYAGKDGFESVREETRKIPSYDLRNFIRQERHRDFMHQAVVSYFGYQGVSIDSNYQLVLKKGMHEIHFDLLSKSISSIRQVYQYIDAFTLLSLIAVPKIVEKEILTSLLQVIRQQSGINIIDRFIFHDERREVSQFNYHPDGINQRGRLARNTATPQLRFLKFPPVTNTVHEFRRQFAEHDNLYPYLDSQDFFQIRNEKQAHLNNYDLIDSFDPQEFFEDQFKRAFKIIEGCIKVRESFSLTDIYKSQTFNNSFEITPEQHDG